MQYVLFCISADKALCICKMVHHCYSYFVSTDMLLLVLCSLSKQCNTIFKEFVNIFIRIN